MAASNRNSIRIQQLCEAIKDLSQHQLELVGQVVDQLQSPYLQIERRSDSEIVNACFLGDFGDTLRLHHAFSEEPFTKDKFEYAFQKITDLCGGLAELAPRGNPGYDIAVNGERFSLKTQADRNIRHGKLHISKFMELGKGEWSDSVDDLVGLRNQFFAHMEAYDRILSLRCLSSKPERLHYELVEIPLSLLLKARHGELCIMSDSRQHPKPGYCDVYGSDDELIFQLYFDGGTERKLQVRNLQKSNCIVHAYWIFSTVSP